MNEDDMWGMLTGNTTQRINQTTILPGGVAGQNQAIIFGDTKNGYIKIDYLNKRIIINDGANDRILIGYQTGGF